MLNTVYHIENSPGNIPYSITSKIVDWCLRAPELTSATLTTQLEYARKRTGDYGSWTRLTVLTWPRHHWRLLARVDWVDREPVVALWVWQCAVAAVLLCCVLSMTLSAAAAWQAVRGHVFAPAPSGPQPAVAHVVVLGGRECRVEASDRQHLRAVERDVARVVAT